MGWSEIFAALTDKKDLSNDQVTWGMSQILEGAASNEDIKAFLTGLKAKGESAQEVEALCLLYTSPSPRDYAASRMPSSA